MIGAQDSLRAEKKAGLDEKASLHAAALRIHALARGTNAERAKLDDIARVDIIEMLESIEQVGRDAGISIEIGQAIYTPDSKFGSKVRSVLFVAEGTGSFTKVMHAAALFESLPRPSFVDELEFEMIPMSASGSKKSSAGVWNLVIRIRFISTAEISS